MQDGNIIQVGAGPVPERRGTASLALPVEVVVEWRETTIEDIDEGDQNIREEFLARDKRWKTCHVHVRTGNVVTPVHEVYLDVVDDGDRPQVERHCVEWALAKHREHVLQHLDREQ